MYRLTTTSLLTLSLLASSSCTAIQDISQFEEDFSCGVDIDLRNYFPHAQEPGSPSDNSSNSATRERFGVYVVQGRRDANGLFRRQYTARAFFDPLPSPDINIQLPFAVEASPTGDVLPATLELHADRQTLRSDPELDFFDISDIPMDHSWVFPHACSEEATEFPHVSDFDQLEDADEQAYGLKIVPSESDDLQQSWVDNTIEIRVVTEAFIDDNEVDQARAFYRRAGATDIPNATSDEAELDMGGVLREDEDIDIIIFVDRNGNGLFDGAPAPADEQDIAFDFSLDLSRTTLPDCDSTTAAACLKDRDEVVINVTSADLARSNSTLVATPWWTRLEPRP